MTYPRLVTIFRLATAATVAALLVSCTRSEAPTADSEVVVATVNEAPITLKDLKIEIARVRGVTPALPARSGTRTEVSRALRQLVERTVVLQEGRRYGVAVSEDEVEEEVRRFRADFPPGGLEKALLQEGIDAEEWREGLRRALLYRKSAKAIALPVAEVPEEEVKKIFGETFGKEAQPERVRVRQLLFNSPAEAAEVRGKIVEGASPDDVMKRFSAGEGLPVDVDLGFLTREELPEEVSAELFLLPAGGVSRVIPRDKTHSLFLVVQKSPSGSLSYGEKAPEIRQELERRRREEAFRTWLDAQIGKAEVRIQEGILAKLSEERK